MSDGDLLDEATRLADGNVGPRSAVAMRTLGARVREAEAQRDDALKLARMRDDEAADARDERDRAYATLDAVREWATSPAVEDLLHEHSGYEDGACTGCGGLIGMLPADDCTSSHQADLVAGDVLAILERE